MAKAKNARKKETKSRKRSPAEIFMFVFGIVIVVSMVISLIAPALTGG